MLKVDLVDDGDDDEVRTTVPSQNPATATLRTEEFFLRTQFFFIALPYISIEVWAGGAGNRRSYLGSQLPARPPYC
jgi:hypothetical protein